MLEEKIIRITLWNWFITVCTRSLCSLYSVTSSGRTKTSVASDLSLARASKNKTENVLDTVIILISLSVQQAFLYRQNKIQPSERAFLHLCHTKNGIIAIWAVQKVRWEQKGQRRRVVLNVKKFYCATLISFCLCGNACYTGNTTKTKTLQTRSRLNTAFIVNRWCYSMSAKHTPQSTEFILIVICIYLVAVLWDPLSKPAQRRHVPYRRCPLLILP